jgi:2-dehydro-3-deoxyphosphogluconate aldolase/(4S)-4-hydroxy-2-oxoglutarate aldolase
VNAKFSSELFEAVPLVGILRGLRADRLAPIVDCMIRGGLTNLEITMNTSDAVDQIREVTARAQGRLNIGAGTVTSRRLLEQALQAGASFIVTPTLAEDVIAQCVAEDVPVFPGALTATEVWRGWEAGARMIKIFPAETFGPSYLRALKAPLPDVKLLPTGGVNLETLPLFVQAGADGFGIGSPLFDRARIENGEWSWLEARCQSFVEAWRRARAAFPSSDS